MGLDIYAYSGDPDLLPEDTSVGQQLLRASGDLTSQLGLQELCHWRNHWELAEWLEMIYRDRGYQDDFNLSFVRIYENDLKAMEREMAGGTLRQEDEQLRLQDAGFVTRAKDLLKRGQAIVIHSWF